MTMPRPLSQHDARDLLERWQDVVRATAAQWAAAPPGARPAWEAARVKAEAVVAALQEAAAAERDANRAWREARAADRKGPPALRLVQ
ncbi:MAG TPA: hypothetical protein VGK67_35150 [Myxococcales bacterium]|jgi:hypothetical protein